MDSLDALARDVTGCRTCPRLVAWREEVARDKRAAFRAEHPGGTVVCVSHADPIKAAVAHALGTHLDLFQRIVIGTCSVSAVAWSTFGPIVLTVNSNGSLADLRPS